MERTQSYLILVLSKLRWCYMRRFATTIFSATRRSNIVSNGYTLFQYLNALLLLKIVVANRLVQHRPLACVAVAGFVGVKGRNFEDTRACSRRLFRSNVSNRRVCFILKTETGICAKRCSQTYGSWVGGARRTRSCCCNRWKQFYLHWFCGATRTSSGEC